MRQAFSLVVITKNAATSLSRCLESANFADDIVVVDSGSTDETATIAKNYGAKFLHKNWQGYGPQKQFAVQAALYDWVLCLDADEWLSENLSITIKEILNNPQAIAYCFPRVNKFMGKFLRYGECYSDISVRFFHRHYARWSDDRVHEYVIVNGRVQKLAENLMHESGENIAFYLTKQNNYTTLQAEVLFERGKKTSGIRLLLSPWLRFIKFYFFRQGFRDGIPGFVHIIIGCVNSFLKYAKLIELQRMDRIK